METEKRKSKEPLHRNLRKIRKWMEKVRAQALENRQNENKEKDPDYREALLRIVKWKRRVSHEYHYMQFNIWPDYWDDDETIEKEAQNLDEYKRNRMLYMRNLRKSNADFNISETGDISIPFSTYRSLFSIIFIFSFWVLVLGDVVADALRYDFHIWLSIAVIPPIVTTGVFYFLYCNDLFRPHYKKVGLTVSCLLTPLIIHLLIPESDYLIPQGNYDKWNIFFTAWGVIGFFQYYFLIFYMKDLNYLINKDYPPVSP